MIRKKVWVVLAFAIGCIAIALLRCCHYHTEIEINELPQTHIFATTDSTDYRYYYISNAPTSLDDLEALIEAFLSKHKHEIENYMTKEACISWCFFQETKMINGGWREGGGYFREDYIEWHKDEAVAYVYADGGTLILTLLKYSNNWFTRGTVLERREYTVYFQRHEDGSFTWSAIDRTDEDRKAVSPSVSSEDRPANKS